MLQQAAVTPLSADWNLLSRAKSAAPQSSPMGLKAIPFLPDLPPLGIKMFTGAIHGSRMSSGGGLVLSESREPPRGGLDDGATSLLQLPE